MWGGDHIYMFMYLHILPLTKVPHVGVPHVTDVH